MSGPGRRYGLTVTALPVGAGIGIRMSDSTKRVLPGSGVRNPRAAYRDGRM